MKIVFQTETETLREVEVTQESITKELIQELSVFDKREVKKLELKLKEGILVENIQDFNNLSDKNVTEFTLTLSN